MLVTNAKKMLSKHGQLHNSGTRYWIHIGPYEVSFLVNGREEPGADITCEHVKRIGAESDPCSDYHPGSYFDSLTQAIKYAKRP
jgi:hypothetical protein